jgi:hypothetical protein
VDELPWTWQERLEPTSQEIRQLIAMNDDPMSIEIEVRRAFIQTNWAVVFDRNAERKKLPRIIYVSPFRHRFFIFGNCIIAGIDEAQRLRPLYPTEVPIIKDEYSVVSANS